MKKILITSILLFGGSAFAQNKDTSYTLVSPITYFDADGNAFMVANKYDHIPTSEDTIQIILCGSDVAIKMMNEYHKTNQLSQPLPTIPARKKIHYKKHEK